MEIMLDSMTRWHGGIASTELFQNTRGICREPGTPTPLSRAHGDNDDDDDDDDDNGKLTSV